MVTELQEKFRADVLKLADEVYAKLQERAQAEAQAEALARITSVLTGPASVPPPSVSEPLPTPREKLTQERAEEALADIVKLLRDHPEGLRSEIIRGKLGHEKPLFQYATRLGLDSDQLVSSGEKRATVYALPGLQRFKGRVIKR